MVLRLDRSRNPKGETGSDWALGSLALHRTRGTQHFHAGRFDLARAITKPIPRRAGRRPDRRRDSLQGQRRLLPFRGLRVQEAVVEFLEARRLAREAGDRVVLGAISVNLSGIYLQLGDAASASLAAEEGLRDIERVSKLPYRAQLLVQLANTRAWSRGLDEALPVFASSIAEADRAGDDSLLALAFEYLGTHSLRLGLLEQAEQAYLKAYWVRRMLKPDEIHNSHANLGRLRLAQGDPASAARLFDLAIAGDERTPGLVQMWTLYHGRGRAKMAQGRLREALADFASAVDLAQRWRADAVAADALRIRTDVGLHEIYGAYVEAGNRLALDGGGTAPARRTFAVSERNRAAGLRERWNNPGDLRRRLPAEYWPVLGQLQSAEAAALRNPTSPTAASAHQLRLRLIEMEAASGVPQLPDSQAGSGDFSRAVQGALSPSEALLCFQFEEKESYLWAVTREEFRLYSLASRGALAPLIARFQEAVRLSRADAVQTGGELYARLFGQVSASVARKASWLLVLDDALFEAPLAAAVTATRNGQPVYLAQSHSLLVIPGAAALLGPRPGALASGRWRFVGLADPVYNRADPRWNRSLPASHGVGSPESLPLELPRLVASAAEIRGCSRLWNAPESVLLEGPAACRARLAEALRERPAVLHLAAHVLSAPGQPDRAMIALSLRPPGVPELLTSSEIPALGAARLVVLSGCSSAAGDALPGAGLIGLTRAWLAAGAERVVASLWPTPDDFGEIFLSFYRHISSDPRQAAEALRKAQLQMLESGGWRSAPSYWAAYVVTGKG
jgi:CHAT domain-containing protein